MTSKLRSKRGLIARRASPLLVCLPILGCAALWAPFDEDPSVHTRQKITVRALDTATQQPLPYAEVIFIPYGWVGYPDDTTDPSFVDPQVIVQVTANLPNLNLRKETAGQDGEAVLTESNFEDCLPIDCDRSNPEEMLPECETSLSCAEAATEDSVTGVDYLFRVQYDWHSEIVRGLAVEGTEIVGDRFTVIVLSIGDVEVAYATANSGVAAP